MSAFYYFSRSIGPYFKVKLLGADRNSPSKENIRAALKKLPASTNLFDAHSGVANVEQLKTNRLNSGGFATLIGVFEQEFRTQMLAELQDSGVELVAGSTP